MVATKKLREELIERRLCIECCDINDNYPKRRCSRCSRRQYIRERIKTVENHLDYYVRELQNLREEQILLKKDKYAK